MVNLPAREGLMGSVSITKIAIDFSPTEGLTADDIAANGGVSMIENADTGMVSFIQVFKNQKI